MITDSERNFHERKHRRQTKENFILNNISYIFLHHFILKFLEIFLPFFLRMF